jgi:hypothetical protein
MATSRAVCAQCAHDLVRHRSRRHPLVIVAVRVPDSAQRLRRWQGAVERRPAHSADQGQQFRPSVAGRGRGKDWLHGVDLPVVGAEGPSGRRRRSRSGRSCLWGCHSAKSTRPEQLTGRIERPPGLAGPRAVSCGLRGPHYPLRRSRGTRPGFCPSGGHGGVPSRRGSPDSLANAQPGNRLQTRPITWATAVPHHQRFSRSAQRLRVRHPEDVG